MSSRKTLCFTGMGSKEEAELKAQFEQANAQVGKSWSLAPLDSADVLVIDVDSIYGHMTWLREHNTGRRIVALTNGERAEADHILRQPMKIEALAALLRELADAGPVASRVTAEAPAVPAARVKPVAEPAAVSAPKPAATPAPAPVASPSAAKPAAPPASAPTPPAAEKPEPEVVAEAPAPAPAPPPRDPVLSDYLRPGALPGPVKLSMDDAPLLALDPKTQTYLGPATLKPFAPYCQRVIRSDEWRAITPGEFEKLKAELGGAQPFQRLLWLCGLLHGKGHVAEGFDQNQRFKLLKWPQIEREYPKHFRIATVMMKGPQLLTEIAEGAGVPLAEVTDFVNANLFSGLAEMEQPAPPADPNAAQKGGLFGRFRPK